MSAPQPVAEVRPLTTFEAHQIAKQQEATRLSPAARRSDNVRTTFLSGIGGTQFMPGVNPRFRK